MNERDVREDEKILYQDDSRGLEEVREKFVDVLKEIKSASGRSLTWQQLHTYTGIKRSTWKSLVNGQLPPPRTLDFFERVKQLPGVTEEHIERLLKSSEVPNWTAVVSQHLRTGDEKEHRIEIIGENGVNVLMAVRMDSKQYSESELSELTGHVRRQIELSVQLFKSLRGMNRKAD